MNALDDVLFQEKFNDFQEQDNIPFACNHQIVLKVQLHALLPIPRNLDFLTLFLTMKNINTRKTT